MTWAEYLDFGGEVQTESDQTGHEHSYRPSEYGMAWCPTCECWIEGVCGHNNRPMCVRRSARVKKEWRDEELRNGRHSIE